MNRDLKNIDLMNKFCEVMLSVVKDNVGVDSDYYDSSFYRAYAKNLFEFDDFTLTWSESIMEMMSLTGLYFRKVKLPEGCNHISIGEAISNYNNGGLFNGHINRLVNKQYTPNQYEYNINKLLQYFNKTKVNNRDFTIFTLDLFFYNMLSFGYRPVFKNKSTVQSIIYRKVNSIVDHLPRPA